MIEIYKQELNKNKKLTIRVKIKPSVGKNEIIGITDEIIKINIKAPAKENKANEELIKFLSGIFYVDKINISIISGKKSKLKLVKIYKNI